MLKVSTDRFVEAVCPSADRAMPGGSVELHATSARGGAIVLHPLVSKVAPSMSLRRRYEAEAFMWLADFL